MEIGEEERELIAMPSEDPVPAEAPAPVRQPVEVPVEDPAPA